MNNEQCKIEKFVRHQKEGLTLVEVIIVIIIIGIASGLVGILVSRGSGSRELRLFTKDISTTLRYARNRAVAEKKIYCFVIDTDEQMYRLYAEDTDYKEKTLILSESIPEEFQMTIQDSDKKSPHLEFFPRGNATGGLIQITSERGTVYSIDVNRITGKITVEKEE